MRSATKPKTHTTPSGAFLSLVRPVETIQASYRTLGMSMDSAFDIIASALHRRRPVMVSAGFAETYSIDAIDPSTKRVQLDDGSDVTLEVLLVRFDELTVYDARRRPGSL